MAYGNTSVSSFISGIQSAKAKLNVANDTIQSTNYENSAQTKEDYDAYQSYLKDRAAGEADPTKKLALTQKVNTAYSGFVSNESQRQSMAVNEGTGSNTEKYNKLYALYQSAPTDAIRQNLAAQLDSLKKTIGNEADAASAKALTQSKKGVNQALTQQEIALKTLQKAAGTGKPMTDESGNPLILDPKTGQFSIAPAGQKGSIVTARQAAIAKAAYYTNRESILDQAVKSGVDSEGTFQKDLLTMQNSDDFKAATNPELIGALQSGDNAFTNKIDAFGNVKNAQRQVSGYAANGAPTFTNGFLGTTNNATTGAPATSPVDISFNRKAGTGVGDPMDNYTTGSYALPAGDPNANYNRQLKDPVTGKLLYAGTNPKSILTPGIPGSIAQTASDANAGHKVTLLDDLKNVNLNPFSADTGGQYLGHTGELMKNAFGAEATVAKGLLRQVGNNLTFGNYDHIVNSVGNIIGHIAHPNTPVTATHPVTGLPVISPAQVAAKTPSVAVKPIAPTPSIKVVSPAAVAAASPSVAVKPVAPTPSIKVVGPKPAPAPVAQSHWYNPLSWFK